MLQSQSLARAYILNVGLIPSKRFVERAPIGEAEIRATLDRVFGGHGIRAYVRSFEVAQSTTEPTAVIRVTLEGSPEAIEVAAKHFYFIALNLSQDCIAVATADLVEHAPRHLPSGEIDGALIGPYAHVWGAFDPFYFLLPAPPAADGYQGHLPGSGVQRHSADDAYALYGVVMEAHESPSGRRLWHAKKGERVVAAHPHHNAARFMALALLTGA